MDNETPTLQHTTPPENAPAKKFGLEDYTFQFITITGGVLIALLTNGLVQWNSDRLLVREGHTTIARELTANMNDVKLVVGGRAGRMANLDRALQTANELLATRILASRSVNLG